MLAIKSNFYSIQSYKPKGRRSIFHIVFDDSFQEIPAVIDVFL